MKNNETFLEFITNWIDDMFDFFSDFVAFLFNVFCYIVLILVIWIVIYKMVN